MRELEAEERDILFCLCYDVFVFECHALKRRWRELRKVEEVEEGFIRKKKRLCLRKVFGVVALCELGKDVVVVGEGCFGK